MFEDEPEGGDRGDQGEETSDDPPDIVRFEIEVTRGEEGNGILGWSRVHGTSEVHHGGRSSRGCLVEAGCFG